MLTPRATSYLRSIDGLEFTRRCTINRETRTYHDEVVSRKGKNTTAAIGTCIVEEAKLTVLTMRTPALAIVVVLLAGCEKPAPPAMKLDCKAESALTTASFDICPEGERSHKCEWLDFSVPVDQLKLSGVNYTCSIAHATAGTTLECVINRETGRFDAYLTNDAKERLVSGSGTCKASPIAYTL